MAIKLKHLKKFEKHSDYETFAHSESFLTPNVSYCVAQDEIHFTLFEPAASEPVVATVVVQQDRSGSYLCNTEEYVLSEVFDKIEINGIEIPFSDIDSGDWGFVELSPGEYTITYFLKDATIIPTMLFAYTDFVSVTLPNTLTTISEGAFSGAANLTEINIPDTVITIGDGAFCDIGVLSQETTQAINAINPNAFTCD